MKPASITLVTIALLLGASSLSPGCGSTDGRRVVVRFRFASAPEGDAPLGEFDTDTGYHVVLTEARVAIGPAYVLAPANLASRAKPRTILAEFLLPNRARAHGGIDPLSGRAVLAQALEQHALDLLATSPTETSPSIATAGPSGSVTLALDPPTLENEAALHGYHAYVEGVASREGLVVPFAGGIALADSGTTRRVENVALDAVLDEGGVVTIAVHPARLLAGADFDRLGAPDASGIRAIAAGDQVAGAFRIGLHSPTTFTASYTRETP